MNLLQCDLLPIEDNKIYIKINDKIFGFCKSVFVNKDLIELHQELEKLILATPNEVAKWIYQNLIQVSGPV